MTSEHQKLGPFRYYPVVDHPMKPCYCEEGMATRSSASNLHDAREDGASRRSYQGLTLRLLGHVNDHGGLGDALG